MMEIWKNIEGFEGYYQISSYGNVRSVSRTIQYRDGRNFTYDGVSLKITKDTRGYKKVGLNKNGERSTHRIHRLVLENFKPNRTNDKEVNHIDGDKSNNKITNLEWVTSSENTLKGYKLGLFEKARETARNRWKGNSIQAKAILVVDKNNGKKREFASARNASLDYGKSKNYFTQLLRIGGENKYFKVSFAESKKTIN